MAIIDCYDKKRGVTYVYESKSYWDKELKQPRAKRKLLGRRDPQTGALIPTRAKMSLACASSDLDGEEDYKTLYKQCLATITLQNEQIQRLKKELTEAHALCRKQSKCIEKALEALKEQNTPEETPIP